MFLVLKLVFFAALRIVLYIMCDNCNVCIENDYTCCGMYRQQLLFCIVVGISINLCELDLLFEEPQQHNIFKRFSSCAKITLYKKTATRVPKSGPDQNI